MRRVLVIMTVMLLVAGSLGVGTLAAHWPFWRRAWQWHVAGGSPPALPGPVRVLRGGDGARALSFHDDAGLAAVAATARTHALLRVADGGVVAGWFASGVDADSLFDGGELSTAVLAPLFAVLTQRHAGLLDAPVGAWIDAWREDRRGPITPRQLFWQLSGLPAGQFHPLNPFSSRAQLASGPDFSRAALGWRASYPPGTHFEESPVNAQLLAEVASAAGGAPYADLLERRLWSRIAGADAELMLDHRRGNAAAHCCLRARVADWLRLAQLLAEDGGTGSDPLWSPGFVAQLAVSSPVHAGYGLGFRLLEAPAGGGPVLALGGDAGRQLLIWPAGRAALLWFGDGAAPQGLEYQLFP